MGAKPASAAKAARCAAAVGLSCALAATLLASGQAGAVVTVEDAVPVSFVADGQVSATVPARVVCAVEPDGTLVCPDEEAYRIENHGAYGIRVSRVEAQAASPFELAAPGALSEGRNAVQAAFESQGGSFEAADAQGGLAVEHGFAVEAGGSMPIRMTGACGGLDVALTDVAVRAFDVVWTVAPGERG